MIVGSSNWELSLLLGTPSFDLENPILYTTNIQCHFHEIYPIESISVRLCRYIFAYDFIYAHMMSIFCQISFSF